MLIGAARQVSAQPGAPIEWLARVIAVVQGESMRAGSPLGPRRRAFLETMAGMVSDEMERATGTRVDPLLAHGLLVALEDVSLMLKTESADGAFDLERAKRVMLRIVLATVAAPASDTVPALPVLPPPAK